MEFKAVPVTLTMRGYKDVKDLMYEAFPPNQLLPLNTLTMWAKRKGVDFFAFYDDGELFGTTFMMQNEKYAYVLYLAVKDNLRSKGYGSKILEFVKQKVEGKLIFLDVEEPDRLALNNTQRKNRIKFYHKHGIVDAGYTFMEDQDAFRILCANPEEFDVEEASQMISNLSFGMYTVNLKEADRLSI